jgi:iron complex outermembrane receptor protein
MTFGRDDRYDWSIVRGIGSTYGANYRDGLKEVGGAYAVPRLNSYGVERIEYLRGPASLLVGSNSPGGVVNSITKQPTPDTRRSLRVRAGELDRQGIAADLSGPVNDDGTVLYRLVALAEHYDLPTPQTDMNQRYFAPSFTFRLGSDTQLTLLADIQQEKIDGDAYPYSYDEAFGRYVSVIEKGRDRFHRDQWSTGFLLSHRFNDALTFHSRTRYTHTRLDYRRSFPGGLPNGTLVERGAQDMKETSKAWQSDNYVEGKWAYGKWANTTIAGLDLSKVDGSLFRGVGTTSPYDLATGQGVGNYIAPELLPFKLATSRQAGLYVQNQAKFDNRFVIVTGLRQDRYQETIIASWADAPIRQNKLTGRLGGVWLLPNGVSPYVSYSTSFQPQSGAGYDGTPFKPTSGRQYEVGVRYEPVGMNAMFSAAVFDISQRNVAVTDPVQQDFSVQRGQVGSRGLELEANTSLAAGLDLIASYSYTDAKVTEDTNPALVGRKNGLVAAHKASVWLNYRLPSDVVEGMKVGLGVRHTSKVPDYENTRWVPGVTLVDARVGYQVNRQWDMALNARNLFDKRHLINCSYGSCYPGDKREVMMTANYRW